MLFNIFVSEKCRLGDSDGLRNWKKNLLIHPQMGGERVIVETKAELKFLRDE